MLLGQRITEERKLLRYTNFIQNSFSSVLADLGRCECERPSRLYSSPFSSGSRKRQSSRSSLAKSTNNGFEVAPIFYSQLSVRPYDGVRRTPLMYAITQHNNQVVQLLAEKENGHCNLKTVPVHLKIHSNIQTRVDKLGNSSLHIAVLANNVEAIPLVANKVNAFIQNEEGDTPLMLCNYVPFQLAYHEGAREDNYLAMNRLLQKFAHKRPLLHRMIESVDKGKVSAVHVAANKGSYHCLRLLLKYGKRENFEAETDKGF